MPPAENNLAGMRSDEQIPFAVDSLLYSGPLEFRMLGPLLDEVLHTGLREIRVKLLISEAPLAVVLASAIGSDRGHLR